MDHAFFILFLDCFYSSSLTKYQVSSNVNGSISPKKMKSILKTIGLCIIFISSTTLCAQDSIQGVRYDVTSNMLLDLIEKFPNKKDDIEKTITSESPQYIDFLKINTDVIELKWKYDSSLMSVTIYNQNQIYHISNTNELLTMPNTSAIDTLHILKRAIDIDSLFSYQLKEKDAMPLQVFVTDEITTQQLPLHNRINDYPEITVITDLNVFPRTYVFGIPNAFLTYNFKTELVIDEQKLKDLYDAWLKNPESTNERKQLLDELRKR